MSNDIHIVFQVLNFLHSEHHLACITTPAEHLVLINLASHKGKKGICPSIPLIAKELKITRTTVIRSIQKWEQLGIVQIQKNSGKGNHYYLYIPEPSSNIGDTGIKNVTSNIGDTRPVTFTTLTSNIHDDIDITKDVTKVITNKSSYNADQKIDNEKRHDFADSMDQMANEARHIAEHEERKKMEVKRASKDTVEKHMNEINQKLLGKPKYGTR